MNSILRSMLLVSLGSLIRPSLLKGSGSQYAETKRVGDTEFHHL